MKVDKIFIFLTSLMKGVSNKSLSSLIQIELNEINGR